MTKTLFGVIHGKTIELKNDPGLADGEPVRVVIESAVPRPSHGTGALPRAVEQAGDPVWTEETDRIFDELDRERHPVRPFIPARATPRLTLTEVLERATKARSATTVRTRDEIDAELATLRDEADQELSSIETLHQNVVTRGSQS